MRRRRGCRRPCAARRCARDCWRLAGKRVAAKVGRKKRAERLARLFGASPHFALALELVMAGLTNEDAAREGWCDTELPTNAQTRKAAANAVAALRAEIDQLEATIAKPTEDITDLTKVVAELDAAVSMATKLRQDVQAQNTNIISNAR